MSVVKKKISLDFYITYLFHTIETKMYFNCFNKKNKI
jgi:hypothetical protein